MVRRQFPGLREGQDAPARPGFRHPAPGEVQEIDAVTGLLSLRAKRSNPVEPVAKATWIASSLTLLAMTVLAVLSSAHAAPDPAFTQFIVSLWPEAKVQGVSRATFDRETAGLEADYKLPDLILPGRPATGAPAQAEFVQVPADYIREAAIARLAEEGQRLLQKYRPSLDGIEARFGVPSTIVLAIWGRETDF